MSRYKRVVAYCKAHNTTVMKYVTESVRALAEQKWDTYKEKRRDKAICEKNRARLRNRDFSLLSNNCNGGVLCHELGQQFRSQFVNLWMAPDDYIEYVSRLEYYNSREMVFEQVDGIDYPVGNIDGLRIYFMHYQNEQEAHEKWEARKARINYENVFVMMTDQEGCTQKNMKDFDALPYPKVLFTHIPQPDIQSAFYIRGFETQEQVGKLNGFVSRWSIRKWFDQFDHVSWLNQTVEQAEGRSTHHATNRR